MTKDGKRVYALCIQMSNNLISDNRLVVTGHVFMTDVQQSRKSSVSKLGTTL